MNLKECSILSAVIWAIARLDVAPGEGALQQCKIRFPKSPSPNSKIKSSTNEPSMRNAEILTEKYNKLKLHKIKNQLDTLSTNTGWTSTNVSTCNVGNKFLKLFQLQPGKG